MRHDRSPKLIVIFFLVIKKKTTFCGLTRSDYNIELYVRTGYQNGLRFTDFTFIEFRL